MSFEEFDAGEYFQSMQRYAPQKVQIYNTVSKMIIEAKLEPEDIVEILTNIASETAWDVVEYLTYKEYLDKEKEWTTMDSLAKIYCEDFKEEIKNGDFDKRLHQKKSANRRIISPDEMYIVLNRRTNYMPYIKQEFNNEEDQKLYEAWITHNNTRAGQKLYNAMNKELLTLPTIIKENIEMLQKGDTV